ncbi:hypothetical protein PW5551_06930 [Petrotoga sp. 9PW.55.5.1]|uniref:enolase C-terminal domain-like protein n=1 Tax=Petrotoga sp. 9PW.55.5.1 TaxID=1308979 RepID=UPI000DC57563|nr:enolase C-terminal domain-like protein [Petrotoga sp. 9PW.55.5.1]RAO98926.1 hypothetical protein PW5551_06930 [Petrotoga sp. 9PW.55.5.1]
MKERIRDVYYWQERTLLKNLNIEWQEHALFKIVDKNGNYGVGAATPDPFYGETFKTTMAILELLRDLIENTENIENIPDIEKKVNEKIKKDNTSKTAIYLAIYNYINNKYNFEITNLLFPSNNNQFQETLFRVFWKKDVNLFDVVNNIQKNNQIIKIEYLEKPSELDIKDTLKIFRNTKLWIDFNGLLNYHELKQVLNQLKNYNVVALEQPLAKNKESILKNTEVGYPIYWDESIEQSEDILRLSEITNGIVVDITKVGGLTNLKKIYDIANTLNIETVLSTRIEHPLNLEYSNKIKNAFDIVDLDIKHYLQYQV